VLTAKGTAQMIPELIYLLWAVILLVAHVIVQASFSDLSKGLGWALGSRDTDRDQSLTANRIRRALLNYLETLPAFFGLVVFIALTDNSSSLSTLGAALWFWARVIYVPAYATAIPFVRSTAWVVSMIGLLIMIIAVI
jgi:uncharacterized MAPEG superfamily protein